MSTALAMLMAVLLDAALGEPRRAHPLVAFGGWARTIEEMLHGNRRRAGFVAWTLTVIPLVALAWGGAWLAAHASTWLGLAYDAIALYLTLGLRSLGEHAQPVADALEGDDLPAARNAVARMVSRDTQALDATQVSVAATESVLENGSDAVFGALFWFVLLGAPGAVLYRLANTLDAMWGYRTARYERFGWFAARTDDVLNLVPARLTALTYALIGNTGRALRCWRVQAPHWDSPNAGPVMAAGAGALSVRLGGPAPYHGIWKERPCLGEGAIADARSVRRALRLVRGGVACWLAVVLACAWFAQEFVRA